MIRQDQLRPRTHLLAHSEHALAKLCNFPLRLLPARAEVRRDLDDDVRLGQVDRRVAHLGDEDGVVLRAQLEGLERAQPLVGRGGAVDEEPVQLDRVAAMGLWSGVGIGIGMWAEERGNQEEDGGGRVAFGRGACGARVLTV